MTEDAGQKTPDRQMHFRPGIGAYVGLVAGTAALVVVARMVTGGFQQFAGGAWLGGPYRALIVLELALCALAWLHIADNLLRHYVVDGRGLTVYRPFSGAMRIPWEQVVGYRVHGYGQSFTLHLTGSARLLVMLDCLAGGGRLAGIIQSRAGRRPGKDAGG